MTTFPHKGDQYAVLVFCVKTECHILAKLLLFFLRHFNFYHGTP